jgi:P-type Cu+ transporter
VPSKAVAGEASSARWRIEFSVGGMTCAACAARVEKKLNTFEGVTATVNLATERAIITAPEAVPVQQFIDAVQQLGYRAGVVGHGPGASGGEGSAEAGGNGADAARVADLRRRLIVALVLFIPLSDLSMLLSLFPWSRFPGWQWVLIAVAAPVVVWSAWPFHAAALRTAHPVRG